MIHSFQSLLLWSQDQISGIILEALHLCGSSIFCIEFLGYQISFMHGAVQTSISSVFHLRAWHWWEHCPLNLAFLVGRLLAAHTGIVYEHLDSFFWPRSLHKFYLSGGAPVLRYKFLPRSGMYFCFMDRATNSKIL